MNRLILLAGILALATVPAFAQTSSGKVTTGAPTYINNTAAPLSLDTSGNLRVSGSFTPPALQNVNLTQVGGAAIALGQTTMTGSIPVTLASNQSALPVSQSGTWNVATVTTVTAVTAITNALPAGTNIIGNVRIDQTTPGTTNNTTNIPSTAAAVAIVPTVTAAVADSLVLKASAGNLYSVYATNTSVSAGFLMVLNATSEPADGAVTPLHCVALPAGASVGLDYSGTVPARFSTGITAVFSTTGCFTKTTTPTIFLSGAAL